MMNRYLGNAVSRSPRTIYTRLPLLRAAIAASLSVAAVAAGCTDDAFDDATEVEDVGQSSTVVGGGSEAPGTAVAGGLVAYWKLDEACNVVTAEDASGGGARGTRLNGVGCTTDGRIEAAATFDGIDDRIEVPDRPAFHFTNAMTVTAWVKPAQVTAPQTVLSKWYAPDSYTLFIGEGYFQFGVALQNGPTLGVRTPAVANRWTHMAGVFNGSTISLYIDGVLRASAAATGVLQNSPMPINIGHHPSWTGYRGALDEIRLYNYALSASEVQQLGQEVWPNAVSRANSDPWLPQHHGQIRVLRPTVLALNFDNTKTMTQMSASLGRLAGAFKQGSRYHAYSNVAAPAMLQYSFLNIDLRDVSNPPFAGYPYRNSTRYPRENPVQGAWGLDYGALFGPQFAQYYNIRASDGHAMNLCELVNAGIVHEVWIYGNGDVPDVNGAEVLELKPRYDANRVRTPGSLDPCAGNGCFDQDDLAVLPAACTRSIKIGWVNSSRGPGCFMESIGHNIESFGNRNLIPYFTTYWKNFAGFDLNTRYGTPVQSWYSCTYGDLNCLRYTACAHDERAAGPALPSSCSACASTVISRDPYCGQVTWDNICVDEAKSFCGGSSYVAYHTTSGSGAINNYDPVCQNAHFAPNSRGHYDTTSPAVVSSSCEHFRMLDGPNGQDIKLPFSTSKFSGYQSIAPDCGGDWKVFWYQSFPGYGNKAKANGGTVMLPWWPFLYY